MTYERKGLTLSYRGRSKLALKTPLRIHLFENGEDKWNLPRQAKAIITSWKKNLLEFRI